MTELDLARLLVDSAPGPARARLAPVTDLRERLEAILHKARAEWPGIEVPAEALVERLGRAVGEDGDVAALEALHAGDLLLAVACQRQDRVALAALESTVFPAAARTRRGPLPDDVLQRLREKVIIHGKLSEYGGLGGLRQWLRMVGTRLWLDAEGRLPRESPLEDAPAGLDALMDSDPELKLLRREARSLLRGAVQQSFRRLSPRGRTLLRLHHVSGLPHAKLGEMMGAPRSTVAHWLEQARAALMAGAREWLQREHDLGPEELENLVRAAGSRLDLTLSDLLVSRGGAGSTA